MLRSSAALLPLLLGVCFAGCSTKDRTFDTPEESSSGGSAGDKGKSSGGPGSGTGGQGGSHSEEPEPTGPCKDHQCQNGATCEPDGDEDYTCLCAEGFEGDRCEVDIDECADDPCENGGTCANQVGAYECTCPAQWTGKNCHLPRFEVLPENFIPAKLNADGTVAIGKIPTTGANSQAARYLNGQLRELGLFSGDSTSEALAVSSDGETIVGTGAPTVGASRAIRWRGTNMVQLPPVNDDDACRATSVTADGQVVVGVCGDRIVRWTTDGVEDLGVPSGTMYCNHALVSADGGLLMVTCSQSGDNKVFIESPDGFSMLASQPSNCRLQDLASNGSAAVALCGLANTFDSFTWTPAAGVVRSNSSEVYTSVSAAGEALGYVVDFASSTQQAVRWSPDGESQLIVDLLQDASIDVGEIVDFEAVLDVSDDGKTFLGAGRDGDSEYVRWIARL